MRTKGKPSILVVDDEASIQKILKRNLQASGYEVRVADNGRLALDMVRQQHPDLILLDLCMPGELDGLDVCVKIRQSMPIPIIVLSAITEEKKKVRALDLGADDYLTKPFSNEELMARVRACLRRAGMGEVALTYEPEVLRSTDGYFTLDVPRRQLCVGDLDVRLTPTEFELLRQLMHAAGKVVTHRSLLQTVWGPEYGDEADYLRVYIRQLRRKTEAEPSHPHYIHTESGVGYCFRPPDSRNL